jgi:putative holliday junction resolvase
MRILGIDYGDRHIGLAVSDLLRLTAQPLGTYHLKESDKENKAFFRDLVARQAIGEIVIGNPLRMDGTPGTRTQRTQEFAAWLEAAVHKPIVFQDERLTTQQALHFLQDRRIKGKRKKDCEDQIAAVIILSTYLEKLRADADGSKNP